jgi:hypothetical protein
LKNNANNVNKEETVLSALELAQQAYDLRMRRVAEMKNGGGDDEKLESARKRARALRNQEVKVEEAAVEREMMRVVTLEGDAKVVTADALSAIKSDKMKEKLKLELENHVYKKVQEESKCMTKLVRDRLISEAEQCPCERADGSICGRPISSKSHGICSGCRSSQMRKPANLSLEEWDKEKKRREGIRSKEAQERRQRNKMLLDSLASGSSNKKRDRDEDPAAEMVLEQVEISAHAVASAAELMHPHQVCSSDCGETLQEGHIHTCEHCDAKMCDVHECINEHMCVFTAD